MLLLESNPIALMVKEAADEYFDYSLKTEQASY